MHLPHPPGHPHIFSPAFCIWDAQHAAQRHAEEAAAYHHHDLALRRAAQDAPGRGPGDPRRARRVALLLVA